MREIIAGWVLLPLMDVLADPNIINYVTILAATYKSKSASQDSQQQEKVEFLHNFSNRVKKSSALTSDLKTIRKDTDLLYAFMQFLKKENSVHLLQFCLDVGMKRKHYFYGSFDPFLLQMNLIQNFLLQTYPKKN